MDVDRRVWAYKNLAFWRDQRNVIQSHITDMTVNGWNTPEFYDRELSRLSYLIERTEESLKMTRTMYDSTDPRDVPGSAEIVAYYPHAWGTDLSGHEKALIVKIDNRGDHADDCHILDVESGAASIPTAVEWVQSWHKLHPAGLDAVNGWIRKPVLYISESMLANLRAATSGLDYDTWVANWSTGETPVAGCFAKQYTDHGPGGENYDMSLVFDDTWGVKPTAPAPAPIPHPTTPGTAVTGMVFWPDNSWNAHSRLVSSTDGGHTWS